MYSVHCDRLRGTNGNAFLTGVAQDGIKNRIAVFFRDAIIFHPPDADSALSAFVPVQGNDHRRSFFMVHPDEIVSFSSLDILFNSSTSRRSAVHASREGSNFSLE
jgi:hypothetical protein